jgi:hypothetical protein
VQRPCLSCCFKRHGGLCLASSGRLSCLDSMSSWFGPGSPLKALSAAYGHMPQSLVSSGNLTFHWCPLQDSESYKTWLELSAGDGDGDIGCTAASTGAEVVAAWRNPGVSKAIAWCVGGLCLIILCVSLVL